MLLSHHLTASCHTRQTTRHPIRLAIVAVALLVSGCANHNEDNRLLSEQQYYHAAQKAMDTQNYVVAVEQLEQLESRFPFGRYAVQTQLDLIFAYYRSLEYTAAALQAERFIRQHPAHEDVDYAYYMKGLSNFSVDRGLKSRLLPTTPAQRDITPLREAFSDFSLFLNKFPNSRYAADARQRLIYLRNRLAEHELVAARYYLERHAFVAVLNRGKTIMETFPQTPAVPEAMALVIKAYRELGLNDLARQTEVLLAQNFPNHPELDSAGHLQYTPATRNPKPWYYWITFGLLG